MLKKTGLADYDQFNAFNDNSIKQIQPIIYAFCIYSLMLVNSDHRLLYKMLKLSNQLTRRIIKSIHDRSYKKCCINIIGYSFTSSLSDDLNTKMSIIYNNILKHLIINIEMLDNLDNEYISCVEKFNKAIITIKVSNAYDLFLIRYYDYKLESKKVSIKYKLIDYFINNTYYLLLTKGDYNINTLINFYNIDRTHCDYYIHNRKKFVNQNPHSELVFNILDRLFNINIKKK